MKVPKTLLIDQSPGFTVRHSRVHLASKARLAPFPRSGQPGAHCGVEGYELGKGDLSAPGTEPESGGGLGGSV